MGTLFFGLFMCVLFLPFTTPFLTAPVSTALNYTGRNLTCSGQTDTLLSNSTITYQDGGNFTLADYCFIEIVTLLVNNLTETITYRGAIWFWNMYRSIAINQCNFSRTIDIGYGSCTPYYYETATSIQLCICSTNNCSATYASCQASVNQALSSPPPLLPVLQPTLSNTITCQDSYFNYSVTHNITLPISIGCAFLITLGGPDPIKCSTYTPNHTVICLVSYVPMQGSLEPLALIEGNYEIWMSNTISAGALSYVNSSSGFYQYQTSTSIASVLPDNSGQYNWGFCLCTTNNCNVDFTTCTTGMNIPSYLLAYNGSTSTTASTTSTSTGTTISTSTTTGSTSSVSGSTSSASGSTSSVSGSTSSVSGSTSSVSGSINTTLQSSTATSVTTSITTSGISVGNNTTLPNNRTSSSMNVKCNRPLLVATLTIIVIVISSV